MQKAIAIAGIHTDIGKTVVAAIVTEALQADYWKPVQAGSLDNSDSITVKRLLSNTRSIVHPEAVQLQMAASPHTAARHENRTIDYRDFLLPQTNNTLVIETAGGLFSPIDENGTMADFLQHQQLPALLVTRHYLGSINHTLLCIEAMKHRGIPLLGLIVSGNPDENSESFIRNYAGIDAIYHTGELTTVNKETIHEVATKMKPWIQNLLNNG
ncbi:dethiobiotin synthase [Taibaiella soli]|uniref:ATP-dependent dethiobiotin synthetase BioD n=1 Tax=Taibaiella soli TaxID=1649169 RepID=A0A2W2ABY8_9BACT|nr:dethiobiotin synthase [Taibaiella soli]PZF72801.1 dethiobiotin synthase [Taibaiella soli]